MCSSDLVLVVFLVQVPNGLFGGSRIDQRSVASGQDSPGHGNPVGNKRNPGSGRFPQLGQFLGYLRLMPVTVQTVGHRVLVSLGVVVHDVGRQAAPSRARNTGFGIYDNVVADYAFPDGWSYV